MDTPVTEDKGPPMTISPEDIDWPERPVMLIYDDTDDPPAPKTPEVRRELAKWLRESRTVIRARTNWVPEDRLKKYTQPPETDDD